ncbi:MAG: hypothetical protein ACREQY_03780 [Candidatus Binatia bacterium]
MAATTAETSDRRSGVREFVESKLSGWSLVATDEEGGAAVLSDPVGELRVVRRGDELASFRIIGVRAERLVLRPGPTVEPELRQTVREVWLSSKSDPAEPSLQILTTTDDEGAPRTAPAYGSSSGMVDRDRAPASPNRRGP